MEDKTFNINSDDEMDIRRSQMDNGYILMYKNFNLYSLMSLEGTDENIFLVNSLVKPQNDEIEFRKDILRLDRIEIIPYHKGDMKEHERVLPTMIRNYAGSNGKIDKFFYMAEMTPEFQKTREEKFFRGLEESKKTPGGRDNYMKEYHCKSDGSTRLYKYSREAAFEKDLSILLNEELKYLSKFEPDECLKQSVLEFSRYVNRTPLGENEFKKLRNSDGKIPKEESFFL